GPRPDRVVRVLDPSGDGASARLQSGHSDRPHLRRCRGTLAMLPKRLAIAFLFTLASITMPASGVEEGAKPLSPIPKPELTPGQVVEIQLEALQFNDKPAKDAGIATTFRFASPGNRKATG